MGYTDQVGIELPMEDKVGLEISFCLSLLCNGVRAITTMPDLLFVVNEPKYPIIPNYVPLFRNSYHLLWKKNTPEILCFTQSQNLKKIIYCHFPQH